MRRFWLILIAFAAILAGWIVISITSDSSEPSYRGRHLSQWLSSYAEYKHSLREYISDPPELIKHRQEATEAMQAIGTNAIPTLLAWLKAKDPKQPPIQTVVMNWVDRIRGRPTSPYNPAFWKHILAISGFELLGTNGQSAVPALVQIGYDTNYDNPDVVWLCLGNFDTNAANKMINYRISLEENAKRASATNSASQKITPYRQQRLKFLPSDCHLRFFPRESNCDCCATRRK